MLVIGVVIGLIIVIVILSKLLPKIFSIFYQKNLPYTILSVKPPYDATKSTFTMSQFITTLHAIAKQLTWWDSFLKRKKLISCELVSTKKDGIRYILRVPSIHVAVVEKALYGYLPGVIIEKTKDYLPARFEDLAGKELKNYQIKTI